MFIGNNDFISGDYSPLILAVLLKQHNIVRLLTSRGDRIEEPHPTGCQCDQCEGNVDYDELQYALTRLNTYRALCSDLYIIHTSNDPILTAFERSKQMIKMSERQWNFVVSG